MNGQTLSGTTSGIGVAQKPEAPKVGDTIKLVVDEWGGVYKHNEDHTINQKQRLVEVEVKSVKKIKVEFEED